MTLTLKNFITYTSVILILLILLGVVGRMDYEDEVKSFSHYCDMVEKDAWPDFKNLYHKCNNLEEVK